MTDSSSNLSSPPANPGLAVLVDCVFREVFTQLDDIKTQLGDIKTQLDTMNGRLDTLEATVREHSQHSARIDRRLTSATSTTTNFPARLLNSGACEPTSVLTPLVNPVTGENVPDFPRTYGEVRRLNARELGALLRALNLRAARNAEQKRGDFLRAIGATRDRVTRR